MDRSDWRKSFNLEQIPVYRCPHCLRHSLTHQEKDIAQADPEYSRAAQAHEAWEASWITRRCTIAFTCSNAICGERVTMLGDIVVGEDWGVNGCEYFETFVPKVIHPAPPIIDIPLDAPQPVSDAVQKSFELFWISSGACANMLRISVERIMDDASIPVTGPRKSGGTRRLDLADRIELFSRTQPDHADVLDALRHVGNVGSHEGETEDELLLDAYEIYEAALAELYSEKSTRLKAIAQRIIAGKGRSPLI